jgi:biopolymer transport protein ExbB
MDIGCISLRNRMLILAILAIISVLIMAPLVQVAFAQGDAASSEKKEGETKPMESWFHWFIRCNGFIGAVLLGLSIYFVSTISRMFYELRIEVAMSPEVVDHCQELLESRDFKGVFDNVKEDEAFFSRVLTTGISELPNGLAEAREATERVGDALTVEMEKKISMLAVLGTLGPMIGLLGTLKGMIASFGEIARSDQTTLSASRVATGISEALLLTFEGVALSVLAIYFYAFFRNRVQYIASATLLRADQFLRHFAHAARAKKPAGPAEPAAKPMKV